MYLDRNNHRQTDIKTQEPKTNINKHKRSRKTVSKLLEKRLNNNRRKTK